MGEEVGHSLLVRLSVPLSLLGLFRVHGWIFLGLLGLGVILLGANCVAVTIVHVWVDALETQHAGSLRALRLGLRKNREQLSNDIAELKAKLNTLEGKDWSSRR